MSKIQTVVFKVTLWPEIEREKESQRKENEEKAIVSNTKADALMEKKNTMLNDALYLNSYTALCKSGLQNPRQMKGKGNRKIEDGIIVFETHKRRTGPIARVK